MTLDGREQRELVSTCSLDVRGRLAPPFREAGEGARAKGLALAEPETEF
jgi:hypothetical protein